MRVEKNGAQSGKIFGGLWLVFFFQGMGPGFWVPALTNILKAEGYADWTPWVFAIGPACALISPVIGGAMADERVPAQKLFAWCSFVSAAMLCLAFGALKMGLGPVWFMVGLAFYALASGPTWGLLATISLKHLSNGEKNYPLVRVGATFGWIAAGFVASYVLHADSSPVAGLASAVVRTLAGLVALGLPNTPPLGLGKSWRSAFGLGVFSLLKKRDHAVLFGVTGLFSIPLVAFYMYSAEFFKALGDKTPTASMTVAQWSEVAAMLSLSALMVRYRLKTMLMYGLGLSAVRFAMSGYAGFTDVKGWHVAGVALHGVCYTMYFVTAQVYLDRRVDPALRSQAQGLLGLMMAGLGPLIGAFFCGWLRDFCVDDAGNGWENFWWVLAGMIAVCWGAFAVMYRGVMTPGK
ncbi:MFS transporter [Luteolibacter sp. AS25]|uniref:MFS transporter n=1 Tax=Luteolibacter sp. AS25 TaxID=3135776 RepID=UPI00398A7AD4